MIRGLTMHTALNNRAQEQQRPLLIFNGDQLPGHDDRSLQALPQQLTNIATGYVQWFFYDTRQVMIGQFSASEPVGIAAEATAEHFPAR